MSDAPNSELDSLLDDLHSEEPKIRRKAVEQLAKLGDPNAITELARVYGTDDEDPKVKQAAESALLKFARQESGPSGGNSTMRFLSIGLGVSLVVLILLNVVLRLSGGSDDDTAEAGPSPVPTVGALPRAEMLDYLANSVVVPSLENINTLRTEVTTETGTPACTAIIETLPVTEVLPAMRTNYPDVVSIIEEMNLAVDAINGVQTTWTSACAGEAVDLTSADALLAGAEEIITEVATDIVNAQQNPPTLAVPTETPTPTPTNTPTYTPTPRPTVDPTVMSALKRIVDGAIAEMNSLVNNKWTPVQDGGVSPFGCSITSLGEDYVLPEDVAVAEPDLTALVVILNENLAKARASNQSYETNCLNNNLTPEIISQGLTDAQNALDTLTLLQETLAEYGN